MRSHGLSTRISIATAHSRTDRIRWRRVRAIRVLTCQRGVFLLHVLAHAESTEEGGARIAIIMNGSPLFTRRRRQRGFRVGYHASSRLFGELRLAKADGSYVRELETCGASKTSAPSPPGLRTSGPGPPDTA